MVATDPCSFSAQFRHGFDEGCELIGDKACLSIVSLPYNFNCARAYGSTRGEISYSHSRDMNTVRVNLRCRPKKGGDVRVPGLVIRSQRLVDPVQYSTRNVVTFAKGTAIACYKNSEAQPVFGCMQ